MTKEIPVIEPEVILGPNSIERQAPASTQLRSNLGQLANVSGVFLIWFAQLLGKIANPKGSSSSLNRIDVRVSHEDIKAELRELEDEPNSLRTENLRYFKSANREIESILENHEAVLSSKWQSALMSKKRLGMDLEELNNFVRNYHDAIRKWKSLQILWRERPAELRNGENRFITLSDKKFFAPRELHKITCDGKNRLECNRVQIGDFILSGHWERATIVDSLLSGTKLVSRSSGLGRTEYVNSWLHWEQSLRELNVESLHLDVYDGFQEAVQLQHIGLDLVGQKGLHQDFLCIDSAGIHGGEIEQVELTGRERPIRNFSILNSVLRGVVFTGGFEDFRLKGIKSAENISLKDCVFVGGVFEDLMVQGLLLQNVRFEGTIFRRCTFEGATFEMVSFDGGQISQFDCIESRFLGVFHTDVACQRMRIINPIFEEGCQWSGVARNIQIKNAPFQLPGVDISELQVLGLKLDNCFPLRFANNYLLESLIREGRVIVSGADQETTQESPSAEQQHVFYEGKRYWTSSVYDPKEVAKDSLGNISRLQRDMSLEVRETLLAFGSGEEGMMEALPWLSRNDFLPIGQSDYQNLMKWLQTFGGYEHPEFDIWCAQAFTRSDGLVEAIENIQKRLRENGYAFIEGRSLEAIVSEKFNVVCSENQNILLPLASFQFFLEEYSGENGAFFEKLTEHLRKNLPHLLPVNPSWAHRLIRDYRDQNGGLVKGNRRQLIEDETLALEKANALMDMFSEKAMKIERDENLTEKEKERQLRELEQFREIMLDRVLDSDDPGYQSQFPEEEEL